MWTGGWSSVGGGLEQVSEFQTQTIQSKNKTGPRQFRAEPVREPLTAFPFNLRRRKRFGALFSSTAGFMWELGDKRIHPPRSLRSDPRELRGIAHGGLGVSHVNPWVAYYDLRLWRSTYGGGGVGRGTHRGLAPSTCPFHHETRSFLVSNIVSVNLGFWVYSYLFIRVVSRCNCTATTS